MNKLTYYNGVQESLEDVASRMDDFGGPNSHGCYPAAWGYATSTPFNYGKMVTSGGGCSTAVAISWPARIKQGGWRRQFHHLSTSRRRSWRASGCRSRSASTASTKCRSKG